MNKRILKVLETLSTQTDLLKEFVENIDNRVKALEKGKIKLTGGEIYKIKDEVEIKEDVDNEIKINEVIKPLEKLLREKSKKELKAYFWTLVDYQKERNLMIPGEIYEIREHFKKFSRNKETLIKLILITLDFIVNKVVAETTEELFKL